MKALHILLVSGSLATLIATGQPRYQTIDLGTLGGSYSYPYSINNNSAITGGSATAGQNGGLAQTAFLWLRGRLTNLGTLGGAACPNCISMGSSASANGTVAVVSETGAPAPENEDFCGFGTHMLCQAAVWKDGKLAALPNFPGGFNSAAFWTNSKGEIVGFSETGVRDSTCVQPFQKYRFEGARWGSDGRLQRLRPLPGDEVSYAFENNDNGQVVGVSGLCSNTTVPGPVPPSGPHGVIWDKDGNPRQIPAPPGVISVIPTGITNSGVVAGNLMYEDGTIHVFRYSNHGSMQDLGVPDGDFVSVSPCCSNVNERGDIAAFSCPGPTGSCRAILYHDNKWYDLNDLTLPGSAYLTGVAGLNEAGQIAANGLTKSGDFHSYLVTPAETKAVALASESGPVMVNSIQLDGSQSTSVDGKKLTYVWSIPQGYPMAAISQGDSATPTAIFTYRGTYRFLLTVIDANGGTSTDSLTLEYAGR